MKLRVCGEEKMIFIFRLHLISILWTITIRKKENIGVSTKLPKEEGTWGVRKKKNFHALKENLARDAFPLREFFIKFPFTILHSVNCGKLNNSVQEGNLNSFVISKNLFLKKIVCNFDKKS